MPKKGRKAGGRGGDSCVVPFHTYYIFTLSGGAFSTLLSPNSVISARALVEADAWAHFRVTNFAFRLLPMPTVSTSTQVVGFVGGVQDTPPATTSAVAELLPSAILVERQIVPTEWVRPSKSELSGPIPWYKTIPGTADATEESPGYLVVAGNGTNIGYLELRGSFEFKTAVAAANTPLAMSARLALREERVREHLERERALLNRLLAPPRAIATPMLVRVDKGDTTTVP